MKRRVVWFSLFVTMTFSLLLNASVSIELRPDPQGTMIRALNGGTLSPVANMKLLDMREAHARLKIPIVRLHDAPWMNNYVVDIHTIFPNFEADPTDPVNYNFEKTDDYLKAILNAGCRVVFRLGESIEHTEKKYHVHPPSDFSKWGEICAYIIRHYNYGWANGFEFGIEYWEIWNEPDIDLMWTGTKAQFFEFFSTVSTELKSKFPDIKIGGPALAFPLDDDLSPNPFLTEFLQSLKSEKVPLDFFSWHNYNLNPGDLLIRTDVVRKVLNQYGFADCEVHLNEWNYIPDNHWNAVYKKECQGLERRTFYERQSGVEGAAFIAEVLIGLQDKPIDVANFYTTTVGPFGIYSEYGEISKAFYAFEAFAQLVGENTRVDVLGNEASIPILAVQANKSGELIVLLSNFMREDEMVEVRFADCQLSDSVFIKQFIIDERHDLQLTKTSQAKAGNPYRLELKKNTVHLLRIASHE